jgi:hypothetical protein
MINFEDITTGMTFFDDEMFDEDAKYYYYVIGLSLHKREIYIHFLQIHNSFMTFENVSQEFWEESMGDKVDLYPLTKFLEKMNKSDCYIKEKHNIIMLVLNNTEML